MCVNDALYYYVYVLYTVYTWIECMYDVCIHNMYDSMIFWYIIKYLHTYCKYILFIYDDNFCLNISLAFLRDSYYVYAHCICRMYIKSTFAVIVCSVHTYTYIQIMYKAILYWYNYVCTFLSFSRPSNTFCCVVLILVSNNIEKLNSIKYARFLGISEHFNT
jgi:hypothetical protein